MEESEQGPLKSSLKHEHMHRNSPAEFFRQRRSVHFPNGFNTDIETLFVDALEAMGECSLWIILMLTLSSWISIIIALENSFFIATKIINFTCYIPTFQESAWNFEMKRNISTPVYLKGVLQQCFMYDVDYRNLSKMPYEQALSFVEENKKGFKIKACSRAVSDDAYVFEGFTLMDVHLDILCNQHFQRYLWVSGLCGRLLTDIPMGVAADMYGRRCIIRITTLICFLGLLLELLSKNTLSFFAGRIIAGSGGHTSFLIFYLYFTELCSKNTRTVLCQIVFVGWGVGYSIATILLYNVEHLWYLHCAVATPILVCLFGIWYIPESPRWLVAQKRYKNAWQVINDIDNARLQEIEITVAPTERPTIKQQLGVATSSGLGTRIFKSMLMCAASFLAYYTAQKEVVRLHVDLYNYLIVFSLISLMHPLIAMALINFLGKKLSITFVYAMLAVLYCSVLAETAHEKIHSTLFVLLTNFSTLANHLTMAYTVEMYPVAFSGTILGICTSFGTIVVILQEILDSYVITGWPKFDGIILVTVDDRKKVHVKLVKHMWYIMFTTTAMVIVLFLPETSGKVLPLTVQSAKLLN